ncbi:MAG TPA: DNA polymerase ligase N-terminal domain-containing protein, partial [Acidimicrobiales bacterium]|nr:DNA polymerase ligase N-terminal domain-containing protein [Acidimicrobiales bacterium]
MDPLATYRDKRDFTKTREPEGKALLPGRGQLRRFVVQRHRARRLHYDLRLEIDGVLVSWAVPKGPTLDPRARRAAFHVEDHPLDYFDFEGVIPKGEYGGGDVIVWDEGTWQPDEAGDPPDPARAVRDGELHFDLQGQKLRGRFVLVRTSTDAAGKEQWLLLHKKDEYAVPGWDPEDHPRSVLSGRTNDEVKADPDRMWRSDLPANEASITLKPAPVNGPSDDELKELEALGSAGLWHIFGRELRVTNLDKVLFPARPGSTPVTKRELLRYSAQIAPVALPYLARRALNMNRCPNGAETKGFWHKQLPEHAPEWVPHWENPEADKGESRTYLVVDEPAALVWAAN